MGDIEKSNGRLPWRRENRQPRMYRPGPFALIYAGLLAAGLVAAAMVYVVLVHDVPGMRANRADTMKTALLVIGGSGALAGLYVSYRKQRTDEANHLRDQDKLFTERYTTAVAQLGSDAVAVRLGGVYALARIADDSERDRPTCLKVLCAYLRMPYDPDDPTLESTERQVRVTAQTVLADRLRPDHPGFWRDAQIDLRDAYLIDVDLNGIVAEEFRADRATFVGPAWFAGARFGGPAGFNGLTFGGDAPPRGATFARATFRAAAFFLETAFDGVVWFGGATFCGPALFSRTAFDGDALFVGAMFREAVMFNEARFAGDAEFGTAEFRRDLPPEWPQGFAEPPGIMWADPPAAPPGPGPASGPGPATEARSPRGRAMIARIGTRIRG